MSDPAAYVQVIMPTQELHVGDRVAVQAIVREYLEKHIEFEGSRLPATVGGGLASRNPYRIDREGLEQSLIAYCAALRKAVHDG